MKIRIKSSQKSSQPQTTTKDLKPLINVVALLIEWEINDVSEKEEQSKEVSQKI